MSFGGQQSFGGPGGMGGGRMDMMQAQMAMKMMNTAISECFSDCAQDFRSPALTDSEKMCAQNCANRYFKSTTLMAQAMQQVAEKQGGGF